MSIMGLENRIQEFEEESVETVVRYFKVTLQFGSQVKD